MYISAQFIHDRKSIGTDQVTESVRTSSGYAAVLEGLGPVVVASGCPRAGNRYTVDQVGVDSFWGVPVVNLVRLAGGLFQDEESGQTGYMVGVVEGAKPGEVTIGGKTYETDDVFTPGATVSYDFGPDGEARLINVVETATRMTPTVRSGSTPCADYGVGCRTAQIQDQGDGNIGVMVAVTGDTFEVRARGRNGQKLSDPKNLMEGTRLARIMKSMGARFSIDNGEWVWRIDMSKAFEGTNAAGWLGLAHLAGLIKAADGTLPGIFSQLRDWVSGRRPAPEVSAPA